ncbi:MAG: molybdopterin-binding protein [Thermoplasmatota archaeon]
MVDEDPRKIKVGALVVGSEILLGRTRDTNTVFLAEQLFKKGLRLKRWVIVPDLESDISRELNRFIEDGYDIIVISGGMGPTHDDITVEAVARTLGTGLIHNERSLQRMYNKWRAWNPGKELPKSGMAGFKKMAMAPRNFEPIENQEGMVEGLMGTTEEGSSLIFILPGVPNEYKGIVGTHKFQDHLPPGHAGEMEIKEILFKGRESRIASYLNALQGKFPNLDIGSYPQGPMKVTVRLIGDRASIENAEVKVKRKIEELEGSADS